MELIVPAFFCCGILACIPGCKEKAMAILSEVLA